MSATIINYIFYIKNSLKDLDPVAREENKKYILKIGEILELILFTIFCLTPIWRIPAYINMYKNNQSIVLPNIKAITLSVASLFLMYQLNPLDIKNKILKNKKVKDEEKRLDEEEDKKDNKE